MPLVSVPIQLGVPGGMELAVILIIAILIFGADKIPKLARSTGKAIGEYQKGRQTIERELQEIEDAASLDGDVSDDARLGGSSDTNANDGG